MPVSYTHLDYILAYEESYGYMMGDYVRDKDAVTASMMIAEMAAYYFSCLLYTSRCV